MSSKKYVRTITFVSRNKDNKDLIKANKGYKQRSKELVIETDNTSISDPRTYLMNHGKEPGKDILKPFFNFVHEGIPEEVCRIYWGINVSEKEAVISQLQHYLIDHNDVNLSNMNSLICRLAEKNNPKATHHWLFDIDTAGERKVKEIFRQISKESSAKIYKTRSGYAIVSDHGFDTRELLEKFPEATLKKNSPLMVFWSSKDIED